MKRQRTVVPIPWPTRQLRIEDHTIRVCSGQEELVLTLRDGQHLERLLTAFGEAWARWDQKEDKQDPLLKDLQQALPF